MKPTHTSSERSAHLSAADALARLPTPAGERFVTLFRHGTLEVEFYAPRGHDPQSPHHRDELYVVVSGRGEFAHDGRRTTFGPGDCLFVAAGVEHRFERFSDDFGAWVFFYGPEGGEVAGEGSVTS
jgi:mannose-6-phosphate isomerase-like protein (cupin superfamily)